MLIFNEISSGGPGLFFVVALWMLFRYALQNNLHTLWLHTCCLFFEQLASPIYKKYTVEPKGLFSNSSTGPSLSSVFYPPGLTPVVKSSRSDFYALLSGSVQKTGFLLGILVVLSFANINAATIKSTATGGDWSSRTTWVGGVVPANGDDVSIPAGSTVAIDANSIVGSLSIFGTLQFEVNTARSLTVLTQVTVNSGGVFQSAQSGTIKNHQLIVQGSIINSGTIDFSSSSNATGVEIVFTGSGNAIFNCSDATLTNLRQINGIVLNKGTSAISVLAFIPGNTFQVLSDGSSSAKGFLSVVNGTFNIIGSNSFSNPIFNTEGDYTIPATGGFWLGNQNATITGMNGTVTNLGDLKITNGTYLVGVSGENSLETLADGQFKMTGGTLSIGGNFKMDGGIGAISGGRINLATQRNSVDNEPTLYISGRSMFEMYGNSIVTIAYPNSKTVPFNDIQIEDGSGLKSIAGGTIQLGTEVTPAGSTFLVNGDLVLNRLTVWNECTIPVFNTSYADITSTPISSLPKIAFDKIAPDLTAPENIILKCGENLPKIYSSLQEFTNAGGAATDNCTLLPASFKLTGQVRSSTNCPYTITRTYEITDVTGNVGKAEQQIVVEGEAKEPQPEVIAESPVKEELKLKSAMAGATITAIKTGLWSDPTTWDLNRIPLFDDDVKTATYTVTVNAAAVCNNITIETGGTLNYSGANTLQVYGDWTNNGTYNGGTNGIVEFAGTNPATIGGTSTTIFKQFIINKGAVTNILNVNSDIELGGDITFTSGLMQVNSGADIICTHNSGIIIRSIAGLFINGGTFTTGAFSIDNEGRFQIDSGTITIGTSSGNGIVIKSSGLFDINGGTVNIAGRLEVSGGTADISGGTINLNTVGHNSATKATLDLSPTSIFRMTAPGGNIIFQNPNGTGNLDMFIETGGIKTFTGGNITFGTGTAANYRIESEVPFPTNIVAANNANLILKMMVSGNKNYDFPLFTSGGVTIPASIDLTSGSLGIDPFIQIETTGLKYLPNNESDINYLNRYWTVTINDITAPQYNITAKYVNTEFAGLESEIAMGIFEVSKPWKKYDNAGANTLSATGITATSFVFTGITLDQPTVTATATSSPICIGASTTLTATPVGDAPFSYSWLPTANLSSSTISNPVATPASTTAYTVTVTDGNGFTATNVITVTVNPLPTASIAGTTPVCQNATAPNITFTGAVGTAPYTFTYNINGGSNQTVNTAIGNSVTVSAPTGTAGTFTYNLVSVSDANSCQQNQSGTATITVNPTPTVISPGNQTYCSGVATTAISLTGSPSGVTFDISGGASIGLADQTVPASIPVFTPSAGTATVTITPKANGCTGTPVSFFVTVNSIPVITSCPSPISISAAAGTCSATATYTVSATGLPVATFTYTFTGATSGSGNGTGTGSSFNVGVTQVEVSASNSCGSVKCTFTVTITDNEKPVVTCPAAITQNVDAGTCGKVVTYTAPVGTDNCSGATTTQIAGLASGATFPVGITTNTFVVTDAAGNTATCSFTVTITDNEAPVISGCPTSTITVNTGPGRTTCNQTASWTEPTATDACNGVLTYSTRSHAPGVLFNVGTTTVTYTFNDTSGNTSTCTFAVTVVDNTPPTFIVPAATTIYTDASCNFNKLPAQTGSPFTLFDNCTATASLITNYSDTADPTVFCGGANTITRSWSVKDLAGNTTTQTQLITVSDNIAPIITVPNDVTIQCGSSSLPGSTGTATATDNCGGTISITYTDSTVGGTCDKTITRTWRATDSCTNFATGVQFIRVTDTQGPTIISVSSVTVACPADIPLPNTGVVSATDNCSAVSITFYDEISNGLTGKPGYCPTSITRIYRVTDICGNYTDATQTTTIDYTGPSCTTCEECSSRLPYTTLQSFNTIDFTGNPGGTRTETVVRRDACCDPKKSENCASFNILLDKDAVGIIVNVAGVTPQGQSWKMDCVDIEGGKVVCIPDGKFHLFTYCKSGQGEPQLGNDYIFQSVRGAVASSDLNTRVDCSGLLHVTGVTSPVWHSISPGAPNAYDSYLNLADPYNPVFTAPVGSPSVIQYQVCGNIGSVVCGGTSTDCDIVTVYVKEKIDISLNINPDLVCANNIPTITPSISPAGTYTLDWKNPSGVVTRANSYTPTVAGTYTLTVSDIQSGILCSTKDFPFTIAFDYTGPTIQAPPAALQVQCNDPNYQNIINAWRASATATYINAQGNTVTATVTNDFDFSKLNMTCGSTVSVTFSAVDQCSNSNLVTSTITVIDNIKPTITTTAQNMTVECDGSGNTAALNAWLASNGGGISADDCGTVSWTTNYTALSDLCGMTGAATVTFTATDQCGNAVTTTATFRIIDTTPPVITCPRPYYQNANAGTCIAFPVNFGTATATDSCGGTLSATNNAPAQFPVGVTTITWTVTDPCGNTATCEQYVTIYDIQAPVIDCTTTVINATVGPGQCSVSVGLVTPTYTENCNANGLPTVTVSRSDGLPASANFPVGTTTVVWTVTDIYNNFATCTQTVVVTDNIAPTITCPANVTVTAPPPACLLQVITIGAATIGDNCSTTSLTWTKSGATSGSGVGDVNNTIFNGGVTTVTYTVTDAAGNSASCSFTVTVNDQVPPTITFCPPNVLETSLTDLCVSRVTPISPATANDPCGVVVSITHDSPYATNSSTTDASGIYPVGTTTITWSVTDNAGNVVTCTQLVIVTDRQLPSLACPGDASYPADAGLPYKSNVPIALPTYSDNCPGALLTWTMGGATTDTSTNTTGFSTVPTPYSQLNVGNTVIAYTITDVSGQTATCSFVVTITSKPDITCPGSITTYTASNNCGSTLNPGVPTLLEGAQPITWNWVIDAPGSPGTASGTFVGSTGNPGPPDIGLYTFQYGTSTITWSASNISGTDSCTQTVTVIDNIPPIYTPPPTPIEYCVESLFSATYVSTDPVNNVQINPDPDYFLFRTGVNSDTTLDLNVSNLFDNCCPGTTTWTITFSAVPGPVAPHAPVVYPPVSGTGQPSAYPTDIPLWGDGVNFINVVHQISYTVTDCHGNATTFPRSITIKPRPKLTKMP